MTYLSPFDNRVKALESSCASAAEIEASVAVYERVKTAAIICKELMANASAADITAVALEIGRESAARR